MAKCADCGFGIPSRDERCEGCETDVSDVERARALIKRATAQALAELRAMRTAGTIARAGHLSMVRRLRDLCRRERRFIVLSREAIADRRFENDDTIFAPYAAVSAATVGCAS